MLGEGIGLGPLLTDCERRLVVFSEDGVDGKGTAEIEAVGGADEGK